MASFTHKIFVDSHHFVYLLVLSNEYTDAIFRHRNEVSCIYYADHVTRIDQSTARNLAGVSEVSEQLVRQVRWGLYREQGTGISNYIGRDNPGV